MQTIVKRQFTWQEWVEKASTVGPDGFVGHTHEDAWAGGTKADAIRMAKKDGYQDAVPEADALAEGLVDTVRAMVTMETFQAAWDTCGSEVDISRYMAGVPECMVEAQPMRIARSGRAVRIVVSCSYSARVHERMVRQRGAAVMALVYILQQVQHPLEVWASDCIEVAPKRGSWLVEVQRADEPVDIGRIMYAVAHPSMERQLAFSVCDHEPASIRRQLNIGDGYGHSGPTLDSDLPDQAGSTIILPYLTGNEDWGRDASIAWIKEQLEIIFG